MTVTINLNFKNLSVFFFSLKQNKMSEEFFQHVSSTQSADNDKRNEAYNQIKQFRERDPLSMYHLASVKQIDFMKKNLMDMTRVTVLL